MPAFLMQPAELDSWLRLEVWDRLQFRQLRHLLHGLVAERVSLTTGKEWLIAPRMDGLLRLVEGSSVGQTTGWFGMSEHQLHLDQTMFISQSYLLKDYL